VARRGWWALVPILLNLSGCVWTEQAEPSSWMKRLAKQTIAPDSAVIRVAILERPLGDDFINGKLWQHVDELVVDEDRRDLLDVNGFRVGQLVGPPTTEFQQLLLSKRCCAGKDHAFPAGKLLPIPLGPVLPQSSYLVVQGKSSTEVALEDARYCLDVTARFVTEGTKLTFTPRVEHGAPRLPFQAAADHRAWEIRTDKACQRYPELSWDVTLGPNQYVFIGARPDRERSLGQSAFMQTEGAEAVQRLLVIINCRAGTPSEGSGEDREGGGATTPLALQAAMPATRK
jgi:hypothetical protein